jgi:Zn-dependent protease with chaperone function
MFPNELRTNRERTLRRIAKVVSAIAWLLLLLSIVGAIYGVVIAAFILIAHALYLAHVRGNGVRLGPTQLPHLWRKVTAASLRMGLPEPPAAYVLQSGGLLNAYATKLLGRRFVVLHSELVAACDSGDGDRPSEIDFVIAHEVAHIAAGHLSWFLLPVRALPLLGPAYARACEYTCDRAGHAFVGNLEVSSRALAILAAGRHAGRQIDLDAFVEQRRDAASFWMAIYELNSTHPYLPKRIAALRETAAPGSAPALSRNAAAYPLAPMFAVTAGGAGAAPLMIIAVMAAVALPAFQQYVARAKAMQAQPTALASAAAIASAPTPAPAAGEDDPSIIRGDRFGWKIKLPNAKWEQIPAERARAQNRLADRWLTRPDVDAHLIVIGENLGGQALSVDQLAAVVINNAKRRAKKLQILHQWTIGNGRLIEARGAAAGASLTQLFGLFVADGKAYQVYAFVPSAAYGKVKDELFASITSFQP